MYASKNTYKYLKRLFYWILLSEMYPITEVKWVYSVFDCAPPGAMSEVSLSVSQLDFTLPLRHD